MRKKQKTFHFKTKVYRNKFLKNSTQTEINAKKKIVSLGVKKNYITLENIHLSANKSLVKVTHYLLNT